MPEFTDYKVADISPRGLGAARDRDRRDRDARADGAARRVRRAEAAQGRAHRRLPAHDDPDRGADRDADRTRRDGALVVVQHLLDAGPRRCGDRGARHPGLRLEGRDRGGIRVVHRADHEGARRLDAEHGARRRRRRDADHPRPLSASCCATSAASPRRRRPGSTGSTR